MFRTIVRIVRSAVSAAFRAMRKAALVAGGMLAAAAEALLGREEELAEPQILTSEQIEIEHTQHEIKASETLHAANPNASIYRFLATPRMKRDLGMIAGATPEAQAWAHRLTDAECRLVKQAGCEGMLRHISGRKPITGVGQVRKAAPILDFTQTKECEYDLAPAQSLDIPSGYRLAM
jgi:hypothetical protein